MKRRGMMLVEVAMAIAVIGIGLVAILQFTAVSNASHSKISDTTLGLQAVTAAHEYFVAAGYDTVKAMFAGTTYPVVVSRATLYDASGNDLPGYSLADSHATWTQRFEMRQVAEDNFTVNDATSGIMEIKVLVLKNGNPVCHLTKLYAR